MSSRTSRTSAALIAIFAVATGAIPAQAQTLGADPNSAAPFGQPVDDEHVWLHGMLDQFEGRFGKSSGLRWDSEAWAGTDTDRLWLKSEGQLGKHGVVEDGQQEIYYSRPLSAYFDVQVGARYDMDARPGRGWAALGVEGTAPYFFHVSATAFASDKGHFAAKLTGSYDLLLTQQLVLQPELELNLYSKADPKRLVGSGFSDLDMGLRLRYEISRKFAPYVGVVYEKKFGHTASFSTASGDKSDALRFTFGVRAWL